MANSKSSAKGWAELLIARQSGFSASELAQVAQILELPEVSLPEASMVLTKAKASSGAALPGSASAVADRAPLRCPQLLVAQQGSQVAASNQRLDALPVWDASEAAEVEAMLQKGALPASPLTLAVDFEGALQSWKRVARMPVGQELHLSRLIQSISEAHWPDPLPQRSRWQSLRQVHIWVDWHPDRHFLKADYEAVLNALRSKAPRIEWSVHLIGEWTAANEDAAIQPGARVISLAFLDLLPEGLRQAWRDAKLHLQRRGGQCLFGLSELKHSGPRNEVTEEGGIDVALLLAALAPALTVEPALVRAMRLAMCPDAGLEVEAEVWRHDALQGGLPRRRWVASQQAHWLEVLKSLSSSVRSTCWQVIHQHHLHLSQVQRDQELLYWHEAAGREGCASAALLGHVADAQVRFARVAQHLLHLTRGGAPHHSQPTGQRVVCAAAYDRWERMTSGLKAIPGVEDMLLSAALAKAADMASTTTGGTSGDVSEGAEESFDADLWQVAQTLELRLQQSSTRHRPGHKLTDVEVSGKWVAVEQGGKSQAFKLTRQHLPMTVFEWEGQFPSPVVLRGPGGSIEVRGVDRPYWATSFRVVEGTARAAVPLPGGGMQELDLAPVGSSAQHSSGWIVEWDPYGAAIYCNVSGDALKPLFVRLRYLPPATFLMGSPEGVGNDREHPQHPVALTQALWLAETPCTQSLWQAVMGRNPSHFNKGPDAPQRPVENVSWDDVQQFLAKLNPLLPEGCEAALPTEAQWEYACRAGTETAYWWGNEPDDTKANFNMKDEKSITDEDGTTPIDRYPPNPWGFHDMHGNVWEWCADRLRTYEQDTTCDPMGDALGDARVVRGGSWLARPSDCSSANRREWSLDGRGLNRGFRFALRNSSHQGEAPQPGRPKVDDGPYKGGAAGGRSAGAGASGKAARSIDRKTESR